jgi:RND superfamily putative drug exporter
VVVGLCVVGLAAAALPLFGLGLGVSFVGSLPADSGVRAAATAARTGFADGILSPSTVLLEGADLDRKRPNLALLEELIEQQPGVAGVLGPSDVPRPLDRDVLVTEDGGAARLLVLLEDPALGADGIAALVGVQQRLPLLILTAGLSDVTVGIAGDTAAAAYIVQQTRADMMRIAIAALVANFLMLLVFLRAPVAALALLAGSVITLAASLGIASLVFEEVAPGAGLTFYVPFAAAVLLLAFGSDYNIYAVGNIWEETQRRPLRAAIIAVMPGTVATLMVAGLALAASFGLLAVVPLLPFRQLAFVMFLGILLDVLVVRALLVPALLTLFGRFSAWPSRRLMDRLSGAEDQGGTGPASGLHIHSSSGLPGGLAPPTTENPCRSYSLRAAWLSTTTSRHSLRSPRPAAHRSTAPTRRSPTPRPRTGAPTYIETSSAVPGSS